MPSLQLQFRSLVKPLSTRMWLTLLTCTCLTLAVGSASAQAQLDPNQTNGFGNGKLVTFTYLQNFDCVDQPNLDLDFNGIKAQSDPNEMQTPICQVVTGSSSTSRHSSQAACGWSSRANRRAAERHRRCGWRRSPSLPASPMERR